MAWLGTQVLISLFFLKKGEIMEIILRTLGIYTFLLVIFRFAGRRALGEVTTFDLILLLIVSEATQEAMLGEDLSIVTAWIVITTLVGTDILLDRLKGISPKVNNILEGVSTILVQDGKPIENRIKKTGVDIEDILSSARKNYGIGTFDQINHAILERDGAISIIPKANSKGGA